MRLFRKSREPSTGQESDRLRGSARTALVWGTGLTLFSDLAQFAVMLVLVRILSPEEYGTAALAQAILGVASVVSFNIFSRHALQARDPSTVDWQMQMTVAFRVNSVLALVTILAAGVIWFIEDYRSVALPLAALSLVFVFEIAGMLRHRMLEAQHRWKRLRVMMGIGTVLGLSGGLGVALLGGGVWALIVQPILYVIPFAFDLIFIEKFRPDFSWNPDIWKQIRGFGINRIGASAVYQGRLFNEAALLSAFYSIATLGIFSRASGLAKLLVGRLGPGVVLSLYPVLTRAEKSSPRFQRLAGLLLRGVTWLSVPAAALLALTATDVVHLLYGDQWDEVISLLPWAAAMFVGLSIFGLLSNLLVANDDTRIAFWLDLGSGASAIALAVWLIGRGIEDYLVGLSLHGLVFVGIALVVLKRHRVLTVHGVIGSFAPALVSAGVAAFAVAYFGGAVSWAEWWLPLRLAGQLGVFGIVYALILRFVFVGALRELLDVAPGGTIAARMLLVRL